MTWKSERNGLGVEDGSPTFCFSVKFERPTDTQADRVLKPLGGAEQDRGHAGEGWGSHGNPPGVSDSKQDEGDIYGGNLV